MNGKWSRAALITLLTVAGVGGCGAQDDEVDTQAAPLALEIEPDCESVRVSAKLTWPPNHKFRLITLSGGEDLTVTIDSVTQDEPVHEREDRHTSPDARWVEDRTDAVYLRAERSGRGDGRMYRIHFTATREDDDRECTGTVQVGVPHDQGKGSAPVDSGGAYDSFGG
ncbi:hypothetical protein ATI61_1339 [Archangium gephyra]|uniref:Endo-chitinase n=1 Tax=Archangium gephyra TaxID=48 RepID=A0AAC8QIU1_9BACT|nr:hypothetical protein [Archangium gephyra]AKJ08269.1 Endo-chitinase [Archangium gephyra]REG14217.1 hypothetical protein ATI61_1339 [Archangium gephyra]